MKTEDANDPVWRIKNKRSIKYNDNAAIKKFLLFVKKKRKEKKKKRRAQKKGPFKFKKTLFDSLEQ